MISDSSGVMVYGRYDQFLREVLKLPTAVFEGPSFGYTEQSARSCFSQQVGNDLFKDVSLSGRSLVWHSKPLFLHHNLQCGFQLLTNDSWVSNWVRHIWIIISGASWPWTSIVQNSLFALSNLISTNNPIGFLGGSAVKNQPASAGDVGSIPGSGRGKWQPTPVFLPGKSHGQKSLVGYSPWGCRLRHSLATKQQLS